MDSGCLVIDPFCANEDESYQKSIGGQIHQPRFFPCFVLSRPPKLSEAEQAVSKKSETDLCSKTQMTSMYGSLRFLLIWIL